MTSYWLMLSLGWASHNDTAGCGKKILSPTLSKYAEAVATIYKSLYSGVLIIFSISSCSYIHLYINLIGSPLTGLFRHNYLYSLTIIIYNNNKKTKSQWCLFHSFNIMLNSIFLKFFIFLIPWRSFKRLFHCLAAQK